MVGRVLRVLAFEADGIAGPVNAARRTGEGTGEVVAGVDVDHWFGGVHSERAAARGVEEVCGGAEAGAANDIGVVVAEHALQLRVGLANAGADGLRRSEIERRVIDRVGAAGWDAIGPDWQEGIGMDGQNVVEDVAAAFPTQVEVAVVG